MKQLISALIKAQKQMTFASKDSTNTFFKNYKYADLNSVISAIKDILNNNGIAVSQTIENDRLVTHLMHESGEIHKSEMPIIVAKQNDPQAYGSALTYSKRYALQAIVCLPTDDDDAEDAMGRGKKEEIVKPKQVDIANIIIGKNEKLTTTSYVKDEVNKEKNRIINEVKVYLKSQKDKGDYQYSRALEHLGLKKGESLADIDIKKLEKIETLLLDLMNKPEITVDEIPF